MVRFFVYFMLVATVVMQSTAHAAFKETSGVKVKLVSVWTTSGGLLVQTNPKPDISGLTCTNDYWLMLDAGVPGYDAALSLALAAQTSQVNVTVRAGDNGTNEFCKLERIVTSAN